MDFTTIRSTLTSAGHTVEPDSALTAANLADDDLYLIGEPLRAFTPAESADLTAWVNDGGILWFTIDSELSFVALSNPMLSSIGTSISYDTSGISGSGIVLPAGFATDSVFDIVGETITYSPGFATVTGGSGAYVVDDLLAYEQLGAGYVFVSGDRFEHNFSDSTASSTNGKLLLNLAAKVPEPASIVVALGLIATVAGAGRGKRIA